MTLIARLDAWTEASRERERERKLRRANRTPKEILRDRVIGAGFYFVVACLLTWVLGGLKGVAFILKVLFVALHVGAMMDIDLDPADRQAAVNGMLKALDKNSGALSRQVSDAFLDDSDKKRVALGFLITNEGGPRITAIQDGSPGQVAGLQIGDRITRIFGKEIEGNYEAARDLAGYIDHFLEEGSRVPITVDRNGSALDLEMEMLQWTPRRAYDLGLDKGVAHVYIPQFLPGAAEHTAEIIAKHLEVAPVHAVIIDLRGNGGGLAREKRDLAALFVPKGTEVAKIVGRRSYQEASKTDTAERFPDIDRIGVIIDHNSASASEGFAAFVQDYDLGPIAGEQSYGKGSRQVIIGNKGIEPFRFTVSRFTGPKGTQIDGVGITPDIAVGKDESGYPKWSELISKMRLELAKSP